MAVRVESGHNRIFARGKDTTDLSIYRQWLLQNENEDEKRDGGGSGTGTSTRARMRDELY